MMCAGLAVVGIGLLMYPVLKSIDARRAIWYPVLPVVEFTVSAACGIHLLVQLEVVPNHLLWAYVPDGCWWTDPHLLAVVSRLVPRPIALLGLAGHACLGVGVPLDPLGVLDLEAGAGPALSSCPVARSNR